MVASTDSQSQSITWAQQQDQKWQTFARNKMDQLDSLFEDHLRWFRQHKTATSLIATRRALTNGDATDNEPTKRTRFNDKVQGEPDIQQNDTDIETKIKQNSEPANASEITPVNDNVLEIPIQDNHLPATHDIPIEVELDNSKQESTHRPLSPPAKISREYLLRHYEQEEQKYGRYGLRNRSLGSSIATISSSKRSTNSMDILSAQQRRKTISCIDNNNDNDDVCSPRTVSEDTEKDTATATIDTIPMPAQTQTTAPSSPSDIIQSMPSPNLQPSSPTPKDQNRRAYGQEEQFNDEVLLVSRSNNKNKRNASSPATALNDGSSLLDQHSGLGGNNNSLIANEGYSFSSIFSFGRAALEPSIHNDDPNISNISSGSSNSKAYTPKRHTDSHHTRLSRFTHPPSSKNKTSSSHTNSSSTTPKPSKHLSYTPPRPWDTTPVSTSFLSSSTVYSTPPVKRDSSRHVDDHQSSNQKKSPQDKDEKKHDQGVAAGSDQTNEPEHENNATTEEPPQPTTVLIPSWATHPELGQLLKKQISLDADKIFGKMPPLQVSQIVNMGGQ